MNDHHLILGRMRDIITGRMITDTHDERYRQRIAALLIEQKGYQKAEITPRFPLTVQAADKCARIPVAFVITTAQRTAMIVHYGPGSLITRHRPALAMSRLVAPYQIPVVVVTNGEDADILDGPSGRRMAAGLTGIPHKSELLNRMAIHRWTDITAQRAKGEARIVIAYEVDDRCPCDDTACLLEGL